MRVDASACFTHNLRPFIVFGEDLSPPGLARLRLAQPAPEGSSFMANWSDITYRAQAL